MTLQNRVLPTGEFVAQAWRGMLMGNRGILHDEHKRLTRRRWTHPHWVTCVLKYRDWHRLVMTPRTYTELFFVDECAALAAGHRPCGLCRRDDYNRFRHAWARANGLRTLDQDDRILHAARVTRERRQIRFLAAIDSLPDGSFIWHDDAAHLVWGTSLLRCDSGSYTDCLPRPDTGQTMVLTPAPTISAMSLGYVPRPHPVAQRLLNRR